MTRGAYRIWPADAAAAPIGLVLDDKKPKSPPNPRDEKAVEIIFGLDLPADQLPQDQIELQQNIEQVLRALHSLYVNQLTQSAYAKTQFRQYYVRLFLVAQLGLEGDNVSITAAKSELAVITACLINDEAGRIKNGHLIRLGRTAAYFSLPVLVLYVTAKLLPPDGNVAHVISAIGIDRTQLAGFCMLWIGSFVGVWLSYGMRTTTFTLTDLTQTDGDFLSPRLRLLFAATLTMLLGILLSFNILRISIGDIVITNFSTHPMMAFLIGALCGISELLLPAAIGKQATGLFDKLK